MPTRLIRIANIHYDPLDAVFRGIAILRGAGGSLRQRPVMVPAPPDWDHARARQALTDAAV